MDRVSHSLPILSANEQLQKSKDFFELLAQRRTVRDFSSQRVPREVLESAILAAGRAPNGANLQPWHFTVIQSAEVKAQIRKAAEEEEREFYERRAPEEWLKVLSPLETDANKPFLETAPALIAIFQKNKVRDDDGELRPTYYAKESVGIATGMLITALHVAGLATLTHTPSPMGFLNQILERPSEEKPFLLLVVGYPAEDCTVPHINKLPLEGISSWV